MSLYSSVFVQGRECSIDCSDVCTSMESLGCESDDDDDDNDDDDDDDENH